MRLWLLVSLLLVSDLCPFRDEDWVTDYFSSIMCTKRLHCEHTTPRGMEIFRTWRQCVSAAVQDKQRSFPLHLAYTDHDGHRHSPPHQDPLEIIRRDRSPGRGIRMSIPAFVVNSDVSLRAMDVVNGEGGSRFTADKIKYHLRSRSAWLMHHHKTASSHNFQAFSLKRSESGAPIGTTQLEETLAIRYATAASERKTMNKTVEEKGGTPDPQMRQKDNAQQATGSKVLEYYQGQLLKAAAAHFHSPSHTSQLEIQRDASGKMKENHPSTPQGYLMHKEFVKERSLKVASVIKGGGLQLSVVPFGARKVLLKTNRSLETLKMCITELDDPPPTAEIALEIYKVADVKKGMELKLAQITAEAATASSSSEENVKEATDKIERPQADTIAPGNMNINQTKQGKNMTLDVSIIPLAQKLKETVDTAETTAANLEIKHTTSVMEASQINSRVKAERQQTQTSTRSPEPDDDTEPRFRKWKTTNTLSTSPKSPSGLRMREDFSADETKLEDEKAAHSSTALANNRETDRRQRNNTSADSFTFYKPLERVLQQDADADPKATDATVPVCRGLIHRTEPGLKYCLDRLAKMGSKRTTWREPTDAVLNRGDGNSPPQDDEYEHFYYFNGVEKRVRTNFYPHEKKKMMKRSHDGTEKGEGKYISEE